MTMTSKMLKSCIIKENFKALNNCELLFITGFSLAGGRFWGALSQALTRVFLSHTKHGLMKRAALRTDCLYYLKYQKRDCVSFLPSFSHIKMPACPACSDARAKYSFEFFKARSIGAFIRNFPGHQRHCAALHIGSAESLPGSRSERSRSPACISFITLSSMAA